MSIGRASEGEAREEGWDKPQPLLWTTGRAEASIVEAAACPSPLFRLHFSNFFA